MRTFIENYLHFMKNCKRPHYEKLKSLKSGFIENSIFENNRDPWTIMMKMTMMMKMMAMVPTEMSAGQTGTREDLVEICKKN